MTDSVSTIRSCVNLYGGVNVDWRTLTNFCHLFDGKTRHDEDLHHVEAKLRFVPNATDGDVSYCSRRIAGPFCSPPPSLASLSQLPRLDWRNGKLTFALLMTTQSRCFQLKCIPRATEARRRARCCTRARRGNAAAWIEVIGNTPSLNRSHLRGASRWKNDLAIVSNGRIGSSLNNKVSSCPFQMI